MTDPREILARIRKQADAATEGPWEAKHHHHLVTKRHVVSEIPRVVECEGDGGGGLYRGEDTEFIAAARTTVPALLDALEAVLEIHQDGGESQGYLDDGSYGDMPHCCTECGSLGEYGVLWPCPTVEAITTALEATK